MNTYKESEGTIRKYSIGTSTVGMGVNPLKYLLSRYSMKTMQIKRGKKEK
jgi:hypothetical protein